ncbi:LOW QUALITY PROTEIN: Helitron helicase-like protein [Phytophthora palmivora]|uniref:Helitron helicase-like protein n=1 Tax=Phytophthora palmivora TaxID=4796 RepID=A0A2P4WY90_9STRA|nr:LOW QUALITY PROTEIN: Helitron helicase-like protein [Phytophthora palmivora]
MRLFGFPTQGSSHAVVNLLIHLEGMRLVMYRDHITTPQLPNLVRRGDRTKLTADFNLCMQDPEATADLLYKDVPVKYRWDGRLKHWVLYRKYVASLDWYTSRHKTQSGFTVDFYCAIGDHPNHSKILPDHASALWNRFKKDLAEDFFRSIQERDAQNNINRDEEVSWRMAEYKCLMWLADYLISNGKTLSMYGLPDLETYSDVSDEVAIQSADLMDIVAQEVTAYEPDDLERTATLAE